MKSRVLAAILAVGFLCISSQAFAFEDDFASGGVGAGEEAAVLNDVKARAGENR